MATVGIVFVRHGQAGRSGRGSSSIQCHSSRQPPHPCTKPSDPLKPIASSGRFFPVVVQPDCGKLRPVPIRAESLQNRKGIRTALRAEVFQGGTPSEPTGSMVPGQPAASRTLRAAFGGCPGGQSLTRLSARRRVGSSRLRRNVRRFRLTRGTGRRGRAARSSQEVRPTGRRKDRHCLARGRLGLPFEQSGKRCRSRVMENSIVR
jgi:hypothetical protein